jgi:lysophospholipase L1-like esterase
MITRLLIFMFFFAVHPKSSGEISVLCVGDSLTVSDYPGFLSENLDGANVRVSAENGVRAGRVLELLISELKGETGKERPTHIIWYAGINDCAGEGYNGQRDMDRKALRATIEAIELVENFGIDLIVIQHHPWAESRYDRWGKSAECSVRFNRKLDRMIGARDFVRIVDTSFLGVDGKLIRKYDSGDGLHLSVRGYFALAVAIARVINGQ